MEGLRAGGVAQFLLEARDGDDAAARIFADLIGGEPLHPACETQGAAVFEAHGGVDELDGAQVHDVVPFIPPLAGRWRAQRVGGVSPSR